MKKILFLLLCTVSIYGQTSTGQEQEFDYGIKNNSTQTITTPPYLTTTGMDGTQGKIPSALIEKTDNKQNSLAVDGTGTKYPTVDVINSLIVNVKSFGAVGNGVTNDSAAFQAANDYLAANGGGTLNVPRGTYIANFIIDSKVYLKGEGVNATILKSANSSNLDVIQGRNFLTLTGTAKQNPETRGIRYFGISNLLIDGNKANNTSGYGIRFWGCSTIWDNVIVQNCANDGIWSEFTSHEDPTGYADKSTQALESSFRNVKSLGNGSNGWTYSGPHDGTIENFIAFSNVGYALYQTTGYSGVSGRNWNSWLNGNSFYFGAGANVDYLIASGGYSGVGVEFGTSSGGANLTNFTSGGHITGIILRGANHRIEGDISNCRNSGFTAGDGIILDGTIGCTIDITGVGNFNVIKKNTDGENGKNNITAIVNVGTGGTMVSGLDLATSDYLNLRSSGVVAYEKFQIGTATVNFSLPTANFLALSNGSGNSNGMSIKSTGWDFFNRLGSTDGTGSGFLISQNYNFASSTRDNPAYSTAFLKMDVISGSIALGTGNTPTTKLLINSVGWLGILTSPTTSAGTYDILTRNTSTGFVEKVLSNTIATVASPAFTGTPTAPTATVGTNTTQIATTAFVLSNGISLSANNTFTGENTFSNHTILGAPIVLKSYTVATLPEGLQGDFAFVTDALAPTYLTTIVGGGAVVCPVFYNGTAWVSH